MNLRRPPIGMAAGLALAALLVLPATALGANASGWQDQVPWPAACEDGKASLSGLVSDEAGEAVAGARVMAAGETGFGEAETGEDGRYEVDGLCAGDYQVLAYREDGESAGLGFHDADENGEPDLLTLEEETALLDIDIALTMTEVSIIIDPGHGAACDDPRGSLSGKVLDESGAAVAEAEVSAHGGGGYGSALTDENGLYEIEGLCAGDYEVVAMAVTDTSARFGFYDADGDGMPDPASLAADDGALTDVDIVLSEARGGERPEPMPDPGRGPAACEEPAATIAGFVLDEAGDAVEGADVQAFGAGGYGTARTEADGGYLIEDLCGGDYEVAAMHWTDTEVGFGFYDADADGTPDPVSLAADDSAATGIDIVLTESEPCPVKPGEPGEPGEPGMPELPPACEGEGRVAGAATLDDGSAAAGADILVVSEDNADFRQVLADEDGGYAVEGLCDGAYYVVGVRVEDDGGLLLGAYDADGDGEPDALTLGPDGRELAGVDLVLGSLDLPLSGGLAEAIGAAGMTAPAPAE